jgi:hypothetical protein
VWNGNIGTFTANARKKAPNSAEARYLLGIAFEEGDDPSSAEIELRKAASAGYSPELVTPALLRVLLQQADGTFAPTFTLALSAGASVATGDVDADGHPDLYVVQGLLQGQNAPDLLLVNDGDGTSFSDLSIPEASAGSGDVAVPIDYDRNGLTDFVVLNGRVASSPGPVQLIAFTPAP